MRRFVFGFGLAVAAPRVSWGAPAPEVRTGDLVFQRSRTEQAKFIAIATHSPWTHVGVVFAGADAPDGAGPVVLEAGDPVRYTPLATWAARSADDRIAIRRLADSTDVLTDAVLARMVEVAAGWVGLAYDPLFDWSDDRMYCSELVYKLFSVGAGHPIGALRTFGAYDLSEATVAAAVRARWGTPPPADAPVVSPADLYSDVQLVTVCEGTRSACVLASP